MPDLDMRGEDGARQAALMNKALDAAYNEARSLAKQAGISWTDAKRIADVYYGPAVGNNVAQISAAKARAATAEAEVVGLKAERDEARAYAKEVGTTLVKLTCDGSEFYQRAGDDFRVDPAACNTYLRRQREAHHDRVFFIAKRAQEAEATAANLRDRVAVLEGGAEPDASLR